MARRVRIHGDHPHRGEAGTVVPGNEKRLGGLVMFRVRGDDGTEFYVEKACMRHLPSDEDQSMPLSAPDPNQKGEGPPNG
jgi:hypothetical protein